MSIKLSRTIWRSRLAFAILVSILLVSLYNWRFWSATIAAVHPTSFEDVLFIASLFPILVIAHSAILVLVPGVALLRLVAATSFILAATAAFFIDSYDVVIDKEMIRNLLETDAQEASAFLTPRFAAYVFLLGLVPAVLALRVKLVVPAIKQRLLYGIEFFAVGMLAGGSLLFLFYVHYTSFFTENKAVRARLNPAQPVAGAIGYWRSLHLGEDTAFVEDPESKGRVLPVFTGPKPLLLFLVVGEAARAINFQLGGYTRATNPELSATEGVFYFDNVRSCGTSTAVSVPCIFSPRGRDHFDVVAARRHSNLLDTLSDVGFRVEWRENNSSSKGVAARIKTLNFIGNARGAGCQHGVCYDEEMLFGLTDRLKDLKQNAVIVFHDMGSHGPSYWQRYPPRFEKFKPVCRTSELWKCTHEAIVNTYDNTILYADNVLAERIRLLQSLSHVDSLLIYISDHGESLGEYGLYLHGTPYAFAPEEQTRVPYLIWMSEGYRRRFSIKEHCLRSLNHRALSHDNIYHTVLGALGVRDGFYNGYLDVIGACAGSHGHVTGDVGAIRADNRGR